MTILEDIMAKPRLPRATYRLQFREDFNFNDAAELVDYLYAMGISDLYVSPIFKARSNSNHGYDIVDYSALNPKLGSDEDFEALGEALKERGMGILLDIVPNHMGINTENEWWMDVLKHGPSSVYAHYFDIDWRPQNRTLDDKVLIPVLGDHYGRVLEAGQLELVYWHGDFYLHYYEHQFPLTPETYVTILRRVHDHLSADIEEEWVKMELPSVITQLEHLPLYTTKIPGALEVRRREQVIVRWRLLGLFDKSEHFREALELALEELNGSPGDPRSFDTLDNILSRQPYRLAYWRTAVDDINYRRFFDINDMAAIRIEDPNVFRDSHWLVLQLLAEDKVSGLRVDHPDGLWNPQEYFRKLQKGYLLAKYEHQTGHPLVEEGTVDAYLDELEEEMGKASFWPLYVVAEKILSETEPLPYSWAVYGTTGYEFLNAVNNLLVDHDNADVMEDIYQDFTDLDQTFHEMTEVTKRLVMDESLTSEIHARSSELARIVERTRRFRGFTRNTLAFAMSEIIAALSVYRTYITDVDDVSERDRFYIEQAVEAARKRNPLSPEGIWDFMHDVLLLDNLDMFAPELHDDLYEFVMKFQQVTGPVMAKSVEDTAFYRYHRLISLNEVGGHPEAFGWTVDEFHEFNMDTKFPHAMLSTSTHDTKRSEDTRARINVLSEMPDEWRSMVHEWAATNADANSTVSGEHAPSANDEYLLYQTLVGVYTPDDRDSEVFCERIADYMHKAINEAKVNSNWLNPNDDYASAVTGFINAILYNPIFMASFEPFVERVAFFGRFNSLSQTLLKLTSPGVPDIYQSNELWDFSLVDPDNRRPVDWERRRELLAMIKKRVEDERTELIESLVEDAASGAIKFYTIYAALNFRRRYANLLHYGDYQPLTVHGDKARHVVAFMRQHDDASVITVVPRLTLELAHGQMIPPVGGDIWGDTHVEMSGQFSLRNVLTGETIQRHDGIFYLHDLLTRFPVGLFEPTVT